MEIRLVAVDESNYEACALLEVREDQAEFVSPNWLSLLEARYEEGERHPLAIYAGERLVGFVMYVFYPADDDYPRDSWWIERFMIGQQHQRRGLGAAGLRAFVEHFGRERGTSSLRLACHPDNVVMITLAEGAGFARTGEVAAGEVVLKARW